MIWLILGASICLLIGGSLWFFSRFMLPVFEQTPFFAVELSSPLTSGTKFEVQNASDLTIRGTILGASALESRGLILFCHEFQGIQDSALHYCHGLLSHGFTIVTFDFHNHGISDPDPHHQPIHWLTKYDMEDVDAVLSYLAEDSEWSQFPLGIFGISRGGSAALIAAAQSKRIQCVACDSAYSIEIMMEHYTRRWSRLYVPEWLISITPRLYLKWMVRTTIFRSRNRTGHPYLLQDRSFSALKNKPTCLISGKKDSYVKPVILTEMKQRIGPQCDLWIVENAKHNQGRTVDPQAYDAYLIKFFETHLPLFKPVSPA